MGTDVDYGKGMERECGFRLRDAASFSAVRSPARWACPGWCRPADGPESRAPGFGFDRELKVPQCVKAWVAEISRLSYSSSQQPFSGH